jgi:hypothetical protein
VPSATCDSDVGMVSSELSPYSDNAVDNKNRGNENNSVYEYVNIDTQTDELEQQVICNVLKAKASLPHLDILYGKESITCLVDTGSSISLISVSKFNEIKRFITFKNIANNVTISTVNSTVKFYNCVKFTFKVGKFYFNQMFYTVQLDESSSFEAIIGYDFIKRYNLVLDIANNCLKYQNHVLPLNSN